MLDRLLFGGGRCRAEDIESAELVLDPAPIQDILGVDGPLNDDRHCVAILAAFSRRDGSGCAGLFAAIDLRSTSRTIG